MSTILSAINFIDWFSFIDIEVIAQGVSLPLAEWCAQYSCVQTNYAMTMAGIFGIIVLLIKGNKKWWWYTFFAIFTITSITSVGMHTANYGEFQSGVLTTKLVGSYCDMLFCLLIAWSGVCCFIFEFCEKRHQKPFALIITAFALLTIITLTTETFGFKDRPLFIFGGGNAMDGSSGGFSIAEITCFLIALPAIPIAIVNRKSITKTELRCVIFALSIFAIAFIVSNLYGDNEVNSFLLGNLHTHSIYHMLNAMGALAVVFWVDYRTQQQDLKAKELQEKGISPEDDKNDGDPASVALKNSKKDLRSWSVCAGLNYLYILATLVTSIIALVKGGNGSYAAFDFNPYQFFIISIILFAGLVLIGVYVTIKFVKYLKAYKNLINSNEK